MQLELDKYYELSTGVIGKCVEARGVLSIADYLFFADGRRAESGLAKVIREVQILPVLGFELRAGEKYDTQDERGLCGPVVTVADYEPFSCGRWRKRFPFCVCDERGQRYAVAPDGEILSRLEFNAPYCGLRIIAPHVEPKPPTPLERLESIYEQFKKHSVSQAIDEFGAALAALKAEAAQ